VSTRPFAIVVAACALLALPATAGAVGRCGSHPWCDTSLSPDARTELMLKAMSVSDKEGILTGQAASDVDLPKIGWTDGAVGAGGLGSGTSGATAMPAAMALAANFDPEMARVYGRTVGVEVKHRGFDGDFGPTVNIMRTPMGGRSFEAYGEDPFLSARTAVGWIEGFQSEGVMADVKHFAANNQEGLFGVSPLVAPVGGRQFVNVHVDQRTLHEIELQPFEAAVREAHSATVMCSYNLLNGVYACANPFLLKDVLRKQWGWDGFTVSDAVACHETPQDLGAGLDFDIVGSCYQQQMVDGMLKTGAISEKTLDDRVREILRTLFAFGFFDRAAYVNDISQDDKNADMAVADHAEEGGEVLLRNDGVLPLDPAKVHSIAVIGPAANQYISGKGSSQVSPYLKTTALAGIQARAAKAGISVTYDDGTDPVTAASAAKAADVAIVVAGDTESEGVDKPCMSLVPQCAGGQETPPNPPSTQPFFGDQDSMIVNAEQANPHTVVVLETGAPVLTPWRDRTAALLEAWYPGEDGGTAIARVLFGDTEPGGRLPATFPVDAGDIPTASGGPERYPGVLDPAVSCDTGPQAAPCPWWQETYSEGVFVGYRWYDAQHIAPAFPFGFGLSYTHFAYGDVAVERTADGGGEASVTVTNTGDRAGSAVPEVYVSLPSTTAVPQPPWKLAGFDKVQLAPGESRTVSMTLSPRAFSYWSTGDNDWRLVPGCADIAVGTSSREFVARQTACPR
jgi:beta-glucosidase